MPSVVPALKAATAAPAEAGAPDARSGVAAPPESRLLSLDAFRGFTMFWIVGGASIVAGLRALGDNALVGMLVYQLEHSDWEGIRYFDLIWPSFMLMVGAALPFARAKRTGMSTGTLHLQALRRATVLFLLGSLRASLSGSTPALIELSSALQPIAVAYLAAHFLSFTSVRTQILAAAGIWVGYALLLAWVPAFGVPAGNYVRGQNLVTAFDLAVLGKAHPRDWGTLLCTLPTLSTTIVGMLLGRVLISSSTPQRKMWIIGLAGLTGVALGAALSPWVPVIMKIWTTSYGLAATGWACLIFLLFYWLVDVRGWRNTAFPLAVIGMNALAIYISKSIVPLPKIVGVFTSGMREHLGSFTQLTGAVLVIVIEWLILYWMYRRRIFLRA